MRAVCAFLTAVLAAGVPALGAADVRRLAADYVAAYQRQLTGIVADEVYVQDIRSQVPDDQAAVRSRTLRGEVFFIFAAAEREWMAIRDVREMDGVPLPETTNVRDILRTLPPAQIAERMKTYNARFNIGRVRRNINEPTLALLVLDVNHRSRFRFKTDKPRWSGERSLVPLTFRERERPTLIRSVGGASIFVTGELLVDPADGSVWQSTLKASVDGISVVLTTDYGFDMRLGLAVPLVFREEYEAGSKAAAPHEEIAAEARYSNFRRFEVSTRLR